MNLAPFYAPTRCASPRHAVGQVASNPAGAGKWMPSPRHRGGACALRPVVCRRVSFGSKRDNLCKFAAQVSTPVNVDNTIVRSFHCDDVVVGADLNAAPVKRSSQNNLGVCLLSPRMHLGGGCRRGQLGKKVRRHVVSDCLNVHFYGALGVDGFGKGHVVLFAQRLGRVLINEATENLGAFESTNDNPMGAVVVEYGHRTADGLRFGAVCFHYPHTIALRLECVNRYFKKRCDFLDGWQSDTYGRNTKGAEALS